MLPLECRRSGVVPPKNGRQPNKITCSTVLPNGRTAGSYVNQLSNSINAAAGNPVSTPYGPAPNPSAPGPVSVASQVYSGTNFRGMFGKGAGYTANAFLGDAGNFAYAAVSANIGVPYFATQFAAAAYSWTHRPPGDWIGPLGMDPSATVQIPAGMAHHVKDTDLHFAFPDDLRAGVYEGYSGVGLKSSEWRLSNPRPLSRDQRLRNS